MVIIIQYSYYVIVLIPSCVVLIFTGIPDVKGYRSLCWRLLLNYLPCDRNKWDEQLDHHRKLYQQWLGNSNLNCLKKYICKEKFKTNLNFLLK